jgi:cytochrome P450 family 142 subfamily A polypeptide 1
VRSATHEIHQGLNLLDGDWYAEDPDPIWAWMRQVAPVYWDDQSEVWGVARYEDVLAIEKDPATFSNWRGPRPHMDPLPSMISMDDPQHRRRRSLVNRGFTPRRVAELEDFITGLCCRIIDDVCETGTCDFVWDIAARLPLLVIAHLLGFDEEVHDDLLRWSDDMLRATSPTSPPEALEAGMLAALEFREHQLEVIDSYRSHPRPGLISTLCHVAVDGESLDDESIVQETLLLLLGGDETTRHVLTGGMVALLENPEQCSSLSRDLSFLPVAVEELLRWVSPVKNMARTLTRDVEMHGQRLQKNDQILLFYPSANRDEAVFAAPETLDLRREPNPHLAFGFGTHFCLGASLARLELRTMLTEVLTRLPGLKLTITPSDLPRRPSNFISGIESMPICFTPTARSNSSS